MAIFSSYRSRKSCNIFTPKLPGDCLEARCGNVVTFIYYKVAIVGNNIIDLALFT